MTCLETQKMITPFIEDELDNDKIEEFLSHINRCQGCKEELEVYFMVHTGMKLLNEEKSLNDDFHVIFENKLKRTEEKVRRNKLNQIRKRIVLYIVIAGIAILSSIRVGEEIQEIVNPKEVTNVFELRYYFHRYKTLELDKIISDSIENQKSKYEISIQSKD